MFGKNKSEEERRIERVRKQMRRGISHEHEYSGDGPFRTCKFCTKREDDDGYDP